MRFLGIDMPDAPPRILYSADPPPEKWDRWEARTQGPRGELVLRLAKHRDGPTRWGLFSADLIEVVGGGYGRDLTWARPEWGKAWGDTIDQIETLLWMEARRRRLDLTRGPSWGARDLFKVGDRVCLVRPEPDYLDEGVLRLDRGQLVAEFGDGTCETIDEQGRGQFGHVFARVAWPRRQVLEAMGAAA